MLPKLNGLDLLRTIREQSITIEIHSDWDKLIKS